MSSISIVQPGEGEPVNLGTTTMRILEDGRTTAGRIGITVATLAPHTDGPPQHRHGRHDEGFYVISGTARFTSGNTGYDAPTGTLVMIPPGVPHTFENPGEEPMVMLSTFSPSFYVEYFRDIAATIASGRAMTPESVGRDHGPLHHRARGQQPGRSMSTGDQQVREPAPRGTAGGTSAAGPGRPQGWRPSKRAHIISDVAVFVVFLALSAPATTGLAGHEWLAVPFIPIFLGHLVTSWPWITAVLRRGARPRGRPRTNRSLDVLLFVVMVTALYSGFAIIDLLPSVGLDVAPRDSWFSLHSASSTLIVPLVAAHLALHWRWMRRNVLRRRSTAGAPA